MSITSIDSSSLPANSVASTATSTRAAASSPSSGAVSGHQHHRGGGEQFMQDVKQALSQLGINLPTSSASATSASDQNTTTSDSSSSTSGTQAVGQDMHKLMHDLFAALQQAQGQTQSNAGADSDGDNDGSSVSRTKAASYTNLTSGLQNLIQQLASGSTSPSGSTTTNSPLSALQTDFQTLLSDAQKSSAGGTNVSGTSNNGQSATLQSFLQNLLNTLNGQSSTAAALGSVVSTAS